MLVLAMKIVGDEWKLWEAYHVKLPKEGPTMGFGIKFVGPLKMGNTLGHQGVFGILDWLCRCSDWGLNEYATWVKEILLEYKA